MADADWGSAVIAPDEPWLQRGLEILTQLRAGSSPYVGRRLRGLLNAAGFVEVQVTARGRGGGGPGCVSEAEFQASFFDARAVVDLTTERGLASPDEMTTIATAWRRWGDDPAATAARHWFEAVARADTGCATRPTQEASRCRTHHPIPTPDNRGRHRPRTPDPSPGAAASAMGPVRCQ